MSLSGCAENRDLIPACLESLGLMQRTYDGSFDMRISMSFARLALNWVAAWGGRHKHREKNVFKKSGRRDEDERTTFRNCPEYRSRRQMTMTSAERHKQSQSWANTGSSVEVSACDSTLFKSVCALVCSCVCEGHTSVRAFLGEWEPAENPHPSSHCSLLRGNTPLTVNLWENRLRRIFIYFLPTLIYSLSLWTFTATRCLSQ